MVKQTLTIPNISCGHCVMAVKNELSQMEGILSVDGDPETKSIVVSWDAPATLQTIKAKLVEINYPSA